MFQYIVEQFLWCLPHRDRKKKEKEDAKRRVVEEAEAKVGEMRSNRKTDHQMVKCFDEVKKER